MTAANSGYRLASKVFRCSAALAESGYRNLLTGGIPTARLQGPSVPRGDALYVLA
jgi:hypothetical protein